MGFNTKKANENSNIEEVDEMNIDFGEEALAGVESTDEDSKVTELKERLYRDPLTGLYNRTRFEDDRKMIESSTESVQYTVYSIDGNNLKFVNDTYGHEEGDTLLRYIADSMAEISKDNAYHTGGDEFILLFINEYHTTEQADKIIKKFLDLIAEKDKLCEKFPVSASIGFARGISTECSFKSVLDEADEKMMNFKAAYKKAHPEFDMRKARITKDTLKEAAEEGTLANAIKELREEKQAESGVSNSVEEVTEDFTFDGIKEEDSQPLRQPKKSTEIVPVVQDDDLGTYDVSTAEQVYQDNELTEKIQPILHETTQKAVKEAVKYQNDKLKLEVSEVLQDEVGYRLSKYERRRRRRDLKEKLGFIIKGVVIFLVIIFILGNAQLRLRFALVAKDLGNMLSGLMKGEEVNSNQLVHDMFKDLGDELNEVNTIDKGFDIDKEGDLDE